MEFSLRKLIKADIFAFFSGSFFWGSKDLKKSVFNISGISEFALSGSEFWVDKFLFELLSSEIYCFLF